MGQKTNPIGNRLGIIRGWESNWYGGKNYGDKIAEDDKIRKYVNARLFKASVSRVIIERTLKLVTVTITTARPGIIIGKGGQEVDKLKEELKKITGKEVQINIFEIKRPELDAQLVGDSIARQIEARISFRRAMKKAVQSSMRLGAKGVNVVILYPSGKVSNVQEKQLTTLGQNITALEVDGVFDDCQEMVKTAFLDEDIKRTLTSANSINIARWLPQMFYFFFAYKELQKTNKELVFSVPSGNFGNICAGIMAQKLGLPIIYTSAVTDHDSSDAAGDHLGKEDNNFWRDHKSSKINSIRTKTLIEKCDVVVVRFGDKFKQWNAAFDAGYCAAMGTPYITLHNEDIVHPLKEVDAAAMAWATDVDQVITTLQHVTQ